MIYSGLKTGKVTGCINERLSATAQKRDLEMINTFVAAGDAMIFSIPELSVDVNTVIKPDEVLEGYVRRNILRSGLSFMPPDDVTWWESRTTLRRTNDCEVEAIPTAVLAIRIEQNIPEITRLDHNHTTPILNLIKRNGWAQCVFFMPMFEAPHRREHMYSLATHLLVGMDEQGEYRGLRVEIPNFEDYQSAAFEQFLRQRGVEPRGAPDLEAMKEVLAEHCISAVMPVLQGLALLNCKNVSSDVHRYQPRTSKNKKGKGPLARAVYRTLKLVLPAQRERGRTMIGHGDSEATRAFHMVRGHFSVYTEAAPLFGKYTGRYWVPAHTRGTKDAGIVQKTYSIVARDEATT